MILLLIFIAVVIVFQIYLSKRDNKWLGLILPAICLIFSIIMAFGLINYTTLSVKETTITENGELVSNITNNKTLKFLIYMIQMTENKSNEINNIQDKTAIPSAFLTVVSTFLIYNIPTIILLAIYFACNEKIKRKKEIKKMNIRDLE